jgi:uncharacterized membrane protein (GlpM family)
VKRLAEIPPAEHESVGFDPGKLRQVRPGETAVRFAFGALVAAVAALVSLGFGPRIGGLFLAFPAILPASLTLIEKKEGNEKARSDAEGGILGSIGLAAFALVALLLLGRLAPALALALALVAWTAVTLSLYLGARAARLIR